MNRFIPVDVVISESGTRHGILFLLEDAEHIERRERLKSALESLCARHLYNGQPLPIDQYFQKAVKR